ncbi:MAG: hypothetical protein J0H49_30265 [Acidobacteria bacterium]|nr:hypothetical protein [Acidobacteriota bacterium]
MKRALPIAVILLLQAVLLFANLDLLPIWTDELFTFSTVPHPLNEIVPILQKDIHPPLYYFLLHEWPWHSLAGLRAFSGLWTLIATFLLDLLWTRRWRPSRRWLALGLFAFSPCVLLYGRMARSYSMQTALMIAAVYFLWRWIRTKEGYWPALISVLLLLYTHYVPGFAVLAACSLPALAFLGFRRTALLMLGAMVGYLPWLFKFADALRRWGQAAGFSSRYTLTGSSWLEQPIKIGFGVVSLTIGESFPFLALLLVPLVLWLAKRGSRICPKPLVVFLSSLTIVGYLGVSRWVSYPFIPARLLWLIPFLAMGVAIGLTPIGRVRWWAAALLVLTTAVSITYYFTRQNYLNPGYAAPLREIAERLNQQAGPSDLILIDAFNTDGVALQHYLSGRTPSVVLTHEGQPEADRLLPAAQTVWVVRNQRDISPEHVTTNRENAACAPRHRAVSLYEPYAEWQLALLQRFMKPAPTHFYQLTACTPAH